MVGLGGLEPPTSPLSGAFYGAVLCCSWTEIDAIGPKHFDALGPLILNAKVAGFRTSIESAFTIRPRGRERLRCQASVLFLTLVNNSSECNNRSHADLMHNNRSALRRFGKPPSCHVKPQAALTPKGERQFGRLSFFKRAANRGSLCRLFNSGSTFVKIKPSSRLA